MSKTYAHVIDSHCHCGNIEIDLHTDKSESDFTPRACQCTLCRRHGASWIADPDGEVRARIRDRAQVSFYRFGHKTSDFIICKSCGVLMMAMSEAQGRTRAVLNVAAMLDRTFAGAPVATDLEGETVDGRMDRRERNWTGKVVFEG